MPHIDTFTTAQSVVITVWQLSESTEQLLALWGDYPLPTDVTTAGSEKRKREILSTLLLLRHHYGHNVILQHHDNGAPYIQEDNISISHTTSHIAIALHPTLRVGVDIETFSPRVTRVASRILSSDEYTALPDESSLLTDGSSARTMATLMAWSCKEAIFKVYPSAVEFRKDIILSPLTTLPTGATSVILPSLGINITAHYTLYNNCSLAWAVEKK